MASNTLQDIPFDSEASMRQDLENLYDSVMEGTYVGEGGRKHVTDILMNIANWYATRVTADYVEPHIQYCEQQNRLPNCKSCGLERPRATITKESAS